MPTSIATPTVMPTKWPTPMSAIDNDDPSIVPVPPSRNAAEMLVAAIFRFDSRLMRDEVRAPRTMARSPRLLSSPAPRASPTLRISAPATPSG